MSMSVSASGKMWMTASVSALFFIDRSLEYYKRTIQIIGWLVFAPNLLNPVFQVVKTMWTRIIATMTMLTACPAVENGSLNVHLSYFLGPIKKSNLSVQKWQKVT